MGQTARHEHRCIYKQTGLGVLGKGLARFTRRLAFRVRYRYAFKTMIQINYLTSFRVSTLESLAGWGVLHPCIEYIVSIRARLYSWYDKTGNLEAVERRVLVLSGTK